MPQGVEIAMAEYAFYVFINGDQSCDDPTLFHRIIQAMQDAADQKCQELEPWQRGIITNVHHYITDNDNICNFPIIQQTLPYNCL